MDYMPESIYHVELKIAFKEFLKRRFERFLEIFDPQHIYFEEKQYSYLEEKRVGEIFPDFYLKYSTINRIKKQKDSIPGMEPFISRAIVECLTPFSIAISPRIFQKKVRDYKSFCDRVWFVIPEKFPVTWDEIILRDEADFLRLPVRKNPTFCASVRWYNFEESSAGAVLDTPRVFPRIPLKQPKRYAYLMGRNCPRFDYADTLFENHGVGGYGVGGDMPNVYFGYYQKNKEIHRYDFEPVGSAKNCVEFYGETDHYNFETYWSHETGRMDLTAEKLTGKWKYKELEIFLTNVFLEFLLIMGYKNQRVRITRYNRNKLY